MFEVVEAAPVKSPGRIASPGFECQGRLSIAKELGSGRYAIKSEAAATRIPGESSPTIIAMRE